MLKRHIVRRIFIVLFLCFLSFVSSETVKQTHTAKVAPDLATCPSNFIAANNLCWQGDMLPRIEVFDTMMESFFEDSDGNLVAETASVMVFRTFQEDRYGSGNRFGMANANVYMRYRPSPSSQQQEQLDTRKPKRKEESFEIVVNRLRKVSITPGKVHTFKTNIEGTLELDFPPSLDSIVFFRTDFMPIDLWKPILFRDGISKLVNVDDAQLKEAYGANSTQIAMVREVVAKVLSPALHGIPEDAPFVDSTPSKLKKRDRITDEDRELFHSDRHENVQISLQRSRHSDRSNDSPCFISVRENSLHYSCDEHHETSRLVKRNFIRDISDNIHDTFFNVKHSLQEEAFSVAARSDQFQVQESSGDGPFALIINCIISATKKVVTLVISTVSGAVEFVKGIFTKLALPFKNLIDAIRACFNFKEVQNTGRFLAHHMKNMVGTIDNVLTSRLSKFNIDLEDFRGKINATLDESIAYFGGSVTVGKMMSPAEGSNVTGVTGIDDHGKSTDARQNYIRNALASQMSPGEDDHNATIAVGKQFGLDSEKLSKDFVADFEKNVPAENRDAFSEKFHHEMKVFSGPGFLGMTLAGLVKFLKNVINVALDCVVWIRGVVTKYLQMIFKMFDRIMLYRFKLGFITSFFEDRLMQGKAILNFYNLFALMGAVPASIIYRKVYGKMPLSVKAVDILAQTTDMKDYMKNLVSGLRLKYEYELKELSNSISYCIGHVYVVTHTIYAMASFLNQLVWFPFRQIQGYFLGLLQYVMQITSMPFNWALRKEADSPSFVKRMKVWSFSLLSFTFHKGNPTLPALLMPGVINAIAQTALSIPKMALLVEVLVADIKSIKAETTAIVGRKSEALLRFAGYSADTWAQFMEYWTQGGESVFDLVDQNRGNFGAITRALAMNYVFPPLMAGTLALHLGQNILLWVATGFHAARLYTATFTKAPFLS